MVQAVLALLLSLIVASCATIGVQTEGESGPLAWFLMDLKLTGKPGESIIYSFTLVLREREGQALTDTHRSDTVLPPSGVVTFFEHKTERDITFVFQPNQDGLSLSPEQTTKANP